jgi:ABC-type tungstate transport system permease subunit
MSRVARAYRVALRRSAKAALLIALVATVAIALTACGASSTYTMSPARDKNAVPFVIVAPSAVSDLGLATALISGFRTAFPQYNLETTVVASADPAATARAKGGDVAIVAQSGPADSLVSGGFGARAVPVMTDRRVLVGPKDDPAMAGKANSLSDALGKIADAGSGMTAAGGVPVRFVGLKGDSQVDRMWTAAKRRAGGAWYTTVAGGSAQQLQQAEADNAYTIITESAFKAQGAEGSLKVIRASGMPGQTYYVVPLTSAHNLTAAQAFATYIATGEGQDTIAGWGVTGNSGPLFKPANQTSVSYPGQ